MATFAVFVKDEMPNTWNDWQTFQKDDIITLSGATPSSIIPERKMVFCGSPPNTELDVHRFVNEVIENTDKLVIQPFNQTEVDKKLLLQRFKESMLKASLEMRESMELNVESVVASFLRIYHETPATINYDQINKAFKTAFIGEVSEYGLYCKEDISCIDKTLIKIGSAVKTPINYVRLTVLKAANKLEDLQKISKKVISGMEGQITCADEGLIEAVKSGICYVLGKLLAIPRGAGICCQMLATTLHRSLLKVEVAENKKVGMATVGAGVGTLLGFVLAPWLFPVYTATGWFIGWKIDQEEKKAL